MNTLRHFEFQKSIQLAFAIVFAAAGTLYLLKAMHFVLWPLPQDAYDFRIYWIAGKLWASGRDPYGDAFTSEYMAAFGPIGPGDFLPYPPYWFPIMVPLSFLSFQNSFIVWEIFNLVLLLPATFLTARIFAGENRIHFWTAFLVGLGFLCVMQPTVWALTDGQTSILLYFGFAAVFYGLIRKNRWVLLLGLIAVALKKAPPRARRSGSGGRERIVIVRQAVGSGHERR